jgi:hypothetical protein
MRQRAYGGATERRNTVKDMLQRMCENHEKINHDNGWIVEERNKHKVLTNEINQEDYWREIEGIDAAVFVPGHHNNMLDRGHLQYLAFGCLTVAPNIPECLPFGNRLVGYSDYLTLVPFKTECNYLKCKDDYSDLIKILTWKSIHSYAHPFSEMGENSKKLFKETCTPEAIGRWIASKL